MTVERVVVVLVRARNPQNIGAVARAMHDFGFRKLRVVNDFHVPFEAAKSAVDAAEVLQEAEEFASVAEAVKDCTLVFGTTAVGERVVEQRLFVVTDGARMVRTTLEADPGARVALLFGSEKTGLSNEELSHCHALLTIPMHQPEGGRHLSMNLGQAAAVCLFALSQGEGDDGRPEAAGREEAAATAEEQERVTGLLLEVMEATGYRRRYPANARELNVRRLVRRMGLSGADAPAWTGILRQVLWAVRRGGEAQTEGTEISSNRKSAAGPGSPER